MSNPDEALAALDRIEAHVAHLEADNARLTDQRDQLRMERDDARNDNARLTAERDRLRADRDFLSGWIRQRFGTVPTPALAQPSDAERCPTCGGSGAAEVIQTDPQDGPRYTGTCSTCGGNGLAPADAERAG